MPTNLHSALAESGYAVIKGNDGNNYLTFDQSALGFSKRRRQRFIKSPNTAFAPITFPAINQRVQFKLDIGNYDQFEGIFLDLDWLNDANPAPGGSAPSITPAPCFFTLDRYELGYNNSDAPVIYIYPREEYERLQWLSDEQYRNLNCFNALNISQTDYKTPTAIVNDSNVSANKQNMIMSIPLMNPLFSKLNMKSLSGAIYITFYFNSSPYIASANGGILKLQNANLRIITSTNPDTEQEILSLYNSYPTYIPFTYSNILTFPATTLTAGTATDLLLSSLIGKCLGIAISIIPQASYGLNNANGNLNFSSLSGTDTTKETGTFDIVDSRKNTILGSGSVTERYSRSQNMTIYGGGSLSIYQPILWILFANHPASQLISGIVDGFHHFDGSYYLRLTPGPSFTTGSYTVVVSAYMYSAIIQSKGILQRAF